MVLSLAKTFRCASFPRRRESLKAIKAYYSITIASRAGNDEFKKGRVANRIGKASNITELKIKQVSNRMNPLCPLDISP